VSRAWVLRATRVCIGRAHDCDVALPDPLVSHRHCVLACDEDGWFIVDLGSRNGVFVNGERVQRRALRDGDELRVGDSVFRFRTVH
jgi:pSer/pThr/pTyr-binding forkhead associated (FHA) protein